jgi:hypothetical protein
MTSSFQFNFPVTPKLSSNPNSKDPNFFPEPQTTNKLGLDQGRNENTPAKSLLASSFSQPLTSNCSNPKTQTSRAQINYPESTTETQLLKFSKFILKSRAQKQILRGSHLKIVHPRQSLIPTI